MGGGGEKSGDENCNRKRVTCEVMLCSECVG